MDNEDSRTASLVCAALKRKYNGRNRPANITAREWLRPRWDQKWSKAALFDPLFRLNHIYHFIDTHGERKIYRLKPGMFEVWAGQHARNVLLKARQYGYTTLWLLDMLDDCLTRPNRNAQLTAHNIEDAKEMFSDKAKYAYNTIDQWDDDEELPAGCTRDQMVLFTRSIRIGVSLIRETAETLHFSNNSKLRVTTSGRSGTLQRLHVSELGKIAAKFPEKAKEVKTGSVPATAKAVASGKGQIWIESTAEGQQGWFKELCDEAQKLQQSLIANPRELSPQEWKFHFHAWHSDDDYVADPSNIIINTRLMEYFAKLENEHSIHLTLPQKAWYVLTEAEQQGDMKREYPSTPEEAFEASVEGAYFQRQMRDMRESGRILDFDISRNHQVHSLWDLGATDDMVVILWQPKMMQNLIIGYYENSGESFSHYKDWMDGFREENKIVYGTHYGPHDIQETRLGAHENTTAHARALEAGIFFETIVRSPDKQNDIDGLRGWLPSCYLHEANTADLVPHLDGYCKQWDSRYGVWKKEPAKNGHDHACDAMMNGPKAEIISATMAPQARQVRNVGMRGYTA